MTSESNWSCCDDDDAMPTFSSCLQKVLLTVLLIVCTSADLKTASSPCLTSRPELEDDCFAEHREKLVHNFNDKILFSDSILAKKKKSFKDEIR